MDVQIIKLCVLALVFCNNIIDIAATIGYQFGIYENSYITTSIVHDDVSDLRGFWDVRRLLSKTGMAWNSQIK